MKMINSCDGGLPHGSNIGSALSRTVLAVCTKGNVFSTLKQHMLDSVATDNHIYKLKCCSEAFVKIRMHRL